jgi:uncharacterized sulfatase
MIVSDDQGWGDFGFMGHPEIKTPHLDRFAAEGAVFPNGYVPTSLCRASLSTIVTGQYAHQHRICCNDPPEGVDRSAMVLSTPTVPGTLAGRGYASLQTGKWWEGHFSNGGFTEGMTENRKNGRHGDAGLLIGRDTMEPVFSFIDRCQAKGQPFFVWYAPMMPHTPHNPPERLLAKYRDQAPTPSVARYWAMCEWFDETCGQLLDHLDQQGLASNTIVAYVADNGWIQEPTADRYAARSKQSPNEGGLRTPIMIRWPGKVKPRKVEQPVLSIDLAPTLLTAAGARPPREMSGINLLNEKARAARKAIMGECFTHNAVDLARPASSLRWRWILEDGWKLILPAAQNEPDGKPELYHVTEDPMEEKELAATQPDRVRRLTKLLDGWWNGKP